MLTYLFPFLFGQARCAGLEAQNRLLQQQLANLQIISGDDDDDLDTDDSDDRVASAADIPPSLDVQDAEDEADDDGGEEDEKDEVASEGGEDDEEIVSDQDQTADLEVLGQFGRDMDFLYKNTFGL